jgi:hypothetical protein
LQNSELPTRSLEVATAAAVIALIEPMNPK